MKFWKEDAKNGVIVFRKKNTDVSCKLISLILENDNGKMEENIEISKKERKKKKGKVQFASACFKAILFRGGTCFFSR